MLTQRSVIKNSRVKTGFIQADSFESLPRFSLTTSSKLLKGQCKSIIHMMWFQAMVSIALLTNMLLTCMQIDKDARGQVMDAWLHALAASSFAIYILDSILRAIADAKQWWKLFDLVFIAMGLVDTCDDFLAWEVPEDFRSLLHIFSLCRAFRLVQVLPRFRFLRDLNRLIYMTSSCVNTLAWSFLLTLFLMTFWAAVAVTCLNHRVHLLAQGEGVSTWVHCERCQRSFATVMDANLTLFQTIIGGDSWGLVAIPVIEEHPWAAIIFIGGLLTMVFGVLNLIVAVVVDNFADMRSSDIAKMADELDDAEILEKEKLAQMFSLIDVDDSGFVSLAELVNGATQVRQFRNYLRILGVDLKDLGQLFTLLDTKGTGEVDLEEFIECLYRMRHADSRTTTHFVKQLMSDLNARHHNLDAKLDELGDQVVRKLEGNGEVQDDAVIQETLQKHEVNIQEIVESTLNSAAQVALETALETAMEKARSVMGIVAKRKGDIAREEWSRTHSHSDGEWEPPHSGCVNYQSSGQMNDLPLSPRSRQPRESRFSSTSWLCQVSEEAGAGPRDKPSKRRGSQSSGVRSFHLSMPRDPNRASLTRISGPPLLVKVGLQSESPRGYSGEPRKPSPRQMFPLGEIPANAMLADARQKLGQHRQQQAGGGNDSQGAADAPGRRQL